jgi:hypothetical protein
LCLSIVIAPKAGEMYNDINPENSMEK